MNENYKKIILDFDGTLIDTERVMLKCVMEYADLHNVPHDDDFMLQFVGASPTEIIQILNDEFGADFDAVGFITCAVDYFNNKLLSVPTPLRPGAVELLDYLKSEGWSIGLATSTTGNIVAEELKFHDLAKYFDVVVTGDMVSRSKPSPEIYILTTKKMDVLPENCFAVEDSTVGIEAAIAAGMKTIAIPDLHVVRSDLKPKCTKIVNSCFDVIEYIKSTIKE